jgi:hypothetical protein
MVRSLRVLVCVAAASACCGIGLAAAQESGTMAIQTLPAPPPPMTGGVPADHINMLQPIIASKMMVEGFSADLERTVKGAPFTAQVTTSTTQVLGDGNRIVQNSESSLARDSEGRTRREMSVAKIGPWSTDTNGHIIFIRDPVAKASYTLLPDGQHAEKMPMHEMMFQRRVEPSAEDKAKHEAEMAARAKQEGVATQTTTAVYATGGGVGGFSSFILGGPDMGEGKNESLGEQNIEGVRAQGTRVTFTIPAGKIGNERPIEIVSETWYSPDLQMVVQSRNTDPRSGETIYKLTNIMLAEPDASLFQVPASYTIEDHSKMKVDMMMHERGGKPPEEPPQPPQ